MELKNLLERLRNNNANTLEYYIKNKKATKKYCEIYEDLIRVLDFIKSKNIKLGDRIGILGDNSYEWILLDLACAVGGYISVTFHASSFENDLRDIWDKYNLKLLFVDNKEYITAENNKNIYLISSIQQILENKMEKILEGHCFDRDEYFTIIFTSGTTSFPKTIRIKSKIVEDFIVQGQKMFNFKENDKIIIFLPMSHLTQRLYVYGAILCGYNIVMTPPENVMACFKMDKPTFLIAVPYFFESIYRVFMQKIQESFAKNAMFKAYAAVNKYLPESLNNNIKAKLFKEIKAFWGGNMRAMITGSAPINKKVLEFYNLTGIKLYEAYGMNETGLIGINYEGHNRVGSVGRPIPNKEVKISSEGQIMVRSEYCWAQEYLDVSPEINSQVFLEDGFITTGDIGYFDKDGYLYIKGRIKELIVLANGKKVHPNMVEEEINKSALIKQSIVFGSSQPYLTAVIVKNSEDVTYQQLEKEIEKINERIPDYARIKGFAIAKEPFTTKNLLLTNSLKLNRNNIYEVYKSDIAQFY